MEKSDLGPHIKCTVKSDKSTSKWYRSATLISTKMDCELPSPCRIPREVAEMGYGYLEDRRPSSNCDPYKVGNLA